MLETMLAEYSVHGTIGERQSAGDVPTNVDIRTPLIIEVDESGVGIEATTKIEVAKLADVLPAQLEWAISDQMTNDSLHFGVGEEGAAKGKMNESHRVNERASFFR